MPVIESPEVAITLIFTAEFLDKKYVGFGATAHAEVVRDTVTAPATASKTGFVSFIFPISIQKIWANSVAAHANRNDVSEENLVNPW